ncbi:hypothetical protein D3C86_1656440 [compost metagenome]
MNSISPSTSSTVPLPLPDNSPCSLLVRLYPVLPLTQLTCSEPGRMPSGNSRRWCLPTVLLPSSNSTAIPWAGWYWTMISLSASGRAAVVTAREPVTKF